jgi:hypothetical protein
VDERQYGEKKAYDEILIAPKNDKRAQKTDSFFSWKNHLKANKGKNNEILFSDLIKGKCIYCINSMFIF